MTSINYQTLLKGGLSEGEGFYIRGGLIFFNLYDDVCIITILTQS